MAYKPLKIFKYQNRPSQLDLDTEYRNRFEAEGTFRTNLIPYLMSREEVAKSNYPIFVYPLREIWMTSERIQTNSNTITSLANNLPALASQQFFLETLTEEIQSTNDIEGVKSSREEISFAIRRTKENKIDVRLASTVKMYTDIMKGDFIHINSLNDIRTMYDQLLAGELESNDNVDGDLFRREAVHIESHNRDKVVHYAPTGEDNIKQRLTLWIEYINNKDVPFLIKALIGHYYFENTHPFYDGNGRTGRYILSNYLARKLDRFTGVSISQAVQSSKTQYYNAFTTTGDFENKAEGTFFVTSLLDLIEKSQQTIIESLTKRSSKFEEVTHKINTAYKQDIDAKNYVLFLLAQSRLFSSEANGLLDKDILEMAKETRYSGRKVKLALTELECSGEIIKIKGNPLQHIISDSFID